MVDFLNIHFLDKYYFLLIIVLFIFFYFLLKSKKNINNFSWLNDLKFVFKSSFYIFYIKVILLFLIFITFFAIFANPNYKNIDKNITKNGIDIVLAFDISYSMNANDFNPNRITVAKTILNDFLNKQTTNRLWLVVFAWKPFTSIPLTFDYSVLKETINLLDTNTINQNISWLSWTAIWDALLMSSNLFKDENREKVIILLTDWDANTWVDPELAVNLLKEKNIKLYSIWVWSKDWGEVTFNTWLFSQNLKVNPLNEEYLKGLTEKTFWKYYSAVDSNSFENAFNDLEKLEKNELKTEENIYYRDAYDIFVYLLIIFMSFYIFLLFYKAKLD